MGIASKTVRRETDQCACGHGREAHEHYRAGTECSLCDIRQCPEFTPSVVLEYTTT